MKKEQFYIKYGMHENNHYHYKKVYKHCVVNDELDYTLLDKEFQKRINLREEVRCLMASRSGKDIYHLFSSRQTCQTWINNLYMERIWFCISDKLYASLKKVHTYLEGINNEKKKTLET